MKCTNIHSCENLALGRRLDPALKCPKRELGDIYDNACHAPERTTHLAPEALRHHAGLDHQLQPLGRYSLYAFSATPHILVQQ